MGQNGDATVQLCRKQPVRPRDGSLLSHGRVWFVPDTILPKHLFTLPRGKGVTERGEVVLRTFQHFPALSCPFRIRYFVLKISETL